MRLRTLIGGIALSLFAIGAAGTARAQTTGSIVTVTNKSEQVVVGRKVTVGDTVSITVQDSGLPAGQEVVNFVTVTGDTAAKVAAGLTAAINADANLKAIGVSAKKTTESSKQVVNISSVSPNTTSYSGSVNSGGTETLTFSVNNNVAENATVGGTATAGDVVSIIVADPGLTGGQQVISYTVVATDTPTSIATGLAANATANTVLKGVGITATSASQYVTIKSLSLNTTTYSAGVTGTSETISLATNTNAVQDLVLGGTPTAGNIVALEVADAGTTLQFAGVKTTANEALSTICSKLKASVNANTSLKGLGISSTCAGGVLSLASNSPNQTLIQYTIEAQVPTCTLVTPGPWTGLAAVRRCGDVSDAAVSQVLSTLTTLGSQVQFAGGPLTDAASKLQASNFTWFVFSDPVEYFAAAFGKGAGAPVVVGDISPEAYGATYYGSTTTPFSLVFEYRSASTSTLNPNIPHTTAHETGHLLDDVSYGGRIDASFAKTNAEYQQGFLVDDGIFFQSVPACTYNAVDPANYKGLITGFFSD